MVAATVAADAALARATTGDRDALAELWRTYQPALLRYLRTRAVACADDVASTVWIDVGSSIARFTGDGDDFRRWLFTIAHRRSVDEIRRTTRRREVVQPVVGNGRTSRRPPTARSRTAVRWTAPSNWYDVCHRRWPRQ